MNIWDEHQIKNFTFDLRGSPEHAEEINSSSQDDTNKSSVNQAEDGSALKDENAGTGNKSHEIKESTDSSENITGPKHSAEENRTELAVDVERSLRMWDLMDKIIFGWIYHILTSHKSKQNKVFKPSLL